MQPVHRTSRATTRGRAAQSAASVGIACALALVGCGGGGVPARRPNLPAGETRAVASDQVDGGLGRLGAGPPLARADEVGVATWYGEGFSGKRTASGERFDPRAMTAAHRTLPFGTWIEVRRVDTGRSVRVRVNDRGPRGAPERIVDVSRAAADALDLVEAGFARVELRVVRGP